MRGAAVRLAARALAAAALAGAVVAAVLLNLPVHPPGGLRSPSGMPEAPDIVARLAARAMRVAPRPGAPARVVDFLPGGLGWAIAGCGPSSCRVLGTRDDGLSWRVLWRAPGVLTGLAFADGRTGYAWSLGGACPGRGFCPARLWATRDGGATWHLAAVGGRVAWSAVAVAGARTLWVVVGGELLRSVDGGRLWTLVPTPGCIPEGVRFAAGAGVVWGRGAAGPCAEASAKGGSTWRPLLASPLRGAAAAAFSHALADLGLSAFVGPLPPVVAACRVAGAWPAGAGAWLAVRCDAVDPGMEVVLHTPGGQGGWRLAWAVAGCDAACRAAGGGETPLAFAAGAAWRAAPGGVAVSPRPNAPFLSGGRLCPRSACAVRLDAVDGRHAYAATGGGVFVTSDGGGHWHRLWPAAGPGPALAAQPLPGGAGVVAPAVAPGWLVRTADGGRTWRPWRHLAGVTVVRLDFLSSRVGFVYGTRAGTGILLATADGGRRWRAVPLPSGRRGAVPVGEVAFASPSLGVVVDRYGDMWRTEDGGRRWTLLPPLPFGVPQAVAWEAPATLYAAVAQPRRGLEGGHVAVLESRAGEGSWRPLVAWPWPPLGPAAAVLAARGRRIGAAAYGGLLMSGDGGSTWTELRLPSALRPSSLALAGASDGWLRTPAGDVYATSDGGRTWREIAGSG